MKVCTISTSLYHKFVHLVILGKQKLPISPGLTKGIQCSGPRVAKGLVVKVEFIGCYIPGLSNPRVVKVKNH